MSFLSGLGAFFADLFGFGPTTPVVSSTQPVSAPVTASIIPLPVRPVPVPVSPAPISPAPVAPIGTVKPPIRGMTSMGFTAYISDPAMAVKNDLAECYAHPGIYAGAVINLKWSDLEPNPGQYDFSTIETGLAAITAYNAAWPNAPLRAKLRIDAGPNCPGWVYSDIGAVSVPSSAALKHPTSKLPATLTYSYFWTAAYESAWSALMTALAGQYDSNPMVATVCITSASSRTDEPFNIGASSAVNAIYLAAGYTDAQWQAALTNAPADYSAWKLTNLDYAFNPLLEVQSTPPMAVSTAMPIALMQWFRASVGGRAIVSNHGLTYDLKGGGKDQLIWEAQKACGAPVAFQTDGPKLDMGQCVTTAVSYGCTEMEMWDSSTVELSGPAFTSADLAGWSAQILANSPAPV